MIDETKAFFEQQSSDVSAETEVLQRVVSALSPLSIEARRRIIDTVSVFLSVSRNSEQGISPQASRSVGLNRTAPFSEDTSMTPKEFLLEKQPRTDVERIACLAYYLTHYRNTPHFKTIDLSTTNMEAAQPRFSNAANSSNNAVKMGYLVPSTKGQRQLSALGERFVRALPDREAAKQALDSLRRKPRKKKNWLTSLDESRDE